MRHVWALCEPIHLVSLWVSRSSYLEVCFIIPILHFSICSSNARVKKNASTKWKEHFIGPQTWLGELGILLLQETWDPSEDPKDLLCFHRSSNFFAVFGKLVAPEHFGAKSTLLFCVSVLPPLVGPYPPFSPLMFLQYKGWQFCFFPSLTCTWEVGEARPWTAACPGQHPAWFTAGLNRSEHHWRG